MLRLRFEIDGDRETKPRRSGSLVGVAAVAALATGAVLAGNAISGTSSSASTIHACVHKKTGKARIVTARKRCARPERRVTWAKIGRAGPSGAPGPAGAAGAAGAPGQKGDQGPPGITAFNDLDGLPCTRSGQQGTIDVRFDVNVARTRCVLPTDGPICGDGVREGSEACDDGNDNPHDACTNACQPATCGDTFVRPPVEQCDQGGVNTTECDANCSVAYCGDGFTNSARGETCDDGVETAVCDDDCTTTQCGDSHVNRATEDCDDGAGPDCPADCTLP